MSVIDSIIPIQAFEQITNQIGVILKDELLNQAALTGNYDFSKTRVFKERDIAYAPADLPALKVMLERGDFANIDQLNSEGTYRFVIEGTVNSPFVGAEQRGDTIASVKLKRLLGVCRAILMDTRYNALGFDLLINHRHIENIYFGKAETQDSITWCSGRLTLIVRANESVPPITPTMATSFKTNVTLELTEDGYEWITTTY